MLRSVVASACRNSAAPAINIAHRTSLHTLHSLRSHHVLSNHTQPNKTTRQEHLASSPCPAVPSVHFSSTMQKTNSASSDSDTSRSIGARESSFAQRWLEVTPKCQRLASNQLLANWHSNTNGSMHFHVLATKVVMSTAWTSALTLRGAFLDALPSIAASSSSYRSVHLLIGAYFQISGSFVRPLYLARLSDSTSAT